MTSYDIYSKAKTLLMPPVNGKGMCMYEDKLTCCVMSLRHNDLYQLAQACPHNVLHFLHCFTFFTFVNIVPDARVRLMAS